MRAMPLTINWVQCAVVGSCEAGKQCIISHRRREEGATVEQKWRASGQCRVTVGYQHRRLIAAVRYSSRHHREWTALGWRVCKHFLIRSCRDAATTATAAVSVAPLRTTYCSHCSHRSAWPSCPACWNRQMTLWNYWPIYKCSPPIICIHCFNAVGWWEFFDCVSVEEMMYSVTFIGVLSICLGGSLSKQLVKIKGNWLTKAGLENDY